jgi:hypothetical protein
MMADDPPPMPVLSSSKTDQCSWLVVKKRLNDGSNIVGIRSSFQSASARKQSATRPGEYVQVSGQIRWTKPKREPGIYS